MTDRRKTLLTLPPEVAEAFEELGTEARNAYITVLRRQGWTLQSLAEATGVTRERIRQVVLSAHDEITTLPEDLPLPFPPEKPVRPKPVYTEPSPDTLARLLELQPLAQKVRANSQQNRAESEEYTRLLYSAYVDEGVPLYRLALRLGVTHGAIRFRLARYGYKTPETGTSKVYEPIAAANRDTAYVTTTGTPVTI